MKIQRLLKVLIFVAALMSVFAVSGDRTSAVQCYDSDGANLSTFYEGDACPEGTTEAPIQPCDDFSKTILGIPTWYKYLNGEEIAGKCKPIINDVEDTIPIGLAVFEAALVLAGMVAVVMIFVASIKYLMTQGEPEKAAAARKTVINTIIGLIMVLISSRVISYIATTIGKTN